MTGTRASGRPASILLVEDNRADIRLMVDLLEAGKVPKTVTLARDGDEALALLRRIPRPDLVVLDLNLPRRDGRAVLAEMKSDPGLRTIPVIVMTTSSSEADVSVAYDLHANCYIVKPLGLDELATAVRAIEEFWLAGVARLPGDSRR